MSLLETDIHYDCCTKLTSLLKIKKCLASTNKVADPVLLHLTDTQLIPAAEPSIRLQPPHRQPSQ